MSFSCLVRDPEPGEGVPSIPELERADGRHLGGSDGLPLLRGGGTWGQGGEYIIIVGCILFLAASIGTESRLCWYKGVTVHLPGWVIWK
jgi:hypothetical protein